MKAVILVGGEGTRLRPLTNRVPKPALPLAGRPFISYMLEWLGRHGVDEAILACGFEPEPLREAIGDEHAGIAVRYVVEPDPRGTGGGIRFAAEGIEERFLALNGDVLADLDLTALLQEHEASGATATLGLYHVADATGYGIVRRDEEGWVTEFAEKPEPREAAAGGDINAGTYVLEPSVLDRIPQGQEVSIERAVFPALIGTGSGAQSASSRGDFGLRARVLDGYWLDIGTPERFLRASWDILERRVETAVGELAAPEGLLIEPGASLSPEASIRPPALIGAGARVEPGATVGPRAVLGTECIVGSGATVAGSVLGDGCAVGMMSTVREAILASGVEVAAGVELEPGTVAGEGELVGVAEAR